MRNLCDLNYPTELKSSFKNFYVSLLIFLFLIVQSDIIFGKAVTKSNVKAAAKTFVNAEMPGYQIKSVSDLFDSTGIVLGYVVNLNPKGFIVLSSNTDISPIIFYSFNGTFNFTKSDQNILLDFMTWDIQDRVESYSLKSTELQQVKNNNIQKWKDYEKGIYRYSKSSKDEKVYGPWLKFNWGQGAPYNNYCPLAPNTKKRSVVGCTATAASQILNYWQFPNELYFSDSNDGYISKGDHGDINIPNDSSKYDFPGFGHLDSNLSLIKYDNSTAEIGYICFGVGIKVREYYSDNQSSAGINDYFYHEIGYGSATWGSSFYSSYQDVINSIIEGRPCQVSIYSSSTSEGHSVVFDGYNSANSSFHVNMGWSGLDNGWYIPPNLGTTYNFNVMRDVIFNICPKLGWSQWGSDERNTMKTYYSIPSQGLTKWNVTTKDSGYNFEGIVVDPSSNLILTSNPKNKNQNGHPSIMIVGSDGIKKRELFLGEENDSITYPVQSGGGNIFVGTNGGKIYSISPSLTSDKVIFDVPSHDKIFSKLKIDGSGLIYAETDTILYCIDSLGTLKWSIVSPENSSFYKRIPAIDVSRNKVYIACQDETNNTSALLTIDRGNGNILNKQSFSNNSNSDGVGIVSVATNGNAYFGCNNKLYELDPDNNYSLKTLFSGNGNIFNAPAIGKDGLICFSCQNSTDEIDVNCYNPTANTLCWSIPFNLSDVGNNGSIDNIFLDAKNDLCFTVHYSHSDPTQDSCVIYVYYPYGNTMSLKWEKVIGSQEGAVAFGSSNTMYCSKGDTLSALAELPPGQTSFTGYTNDNPPNQPKNICPDSCATDVDTTTTFSWRGSDPDGNSLTYSLHLEYERKAYEYKTGTKDSVEVTDLIKNKTYFWFVTASDGQTITKGPVWSFKTKTDVKNYPPPQKSLNVALSSNGGKAVANSNPSGYYAEYRSADKANDGDSTTYWMTSIYLPFPDWLEITFDKVYSIDTLGIWWTGYQEEFSISLSSDSINWTTVVPEQWAIYKDPGTPVHQIIPIQSTKAKYIKIGVDNFWFIENGVSYSYYPAEVAELEAYSPEKTTGIIEELDGRSITIYPNPTQSTINIQFKDLTYHNISINIYDRQGKKLITKHYTQIPTAPIHLNVANYPMGLYYIQVVTNKGMVTKKFIIER